jgi:RNA polymerase sigma-70 factor (sigma-E family)
VVYAGKEVAVDNLADTEFSTYMHARWGQLVRLGFGLTGDRQLGEDLAQTALARAYVSWARVRRSGNPDAYVNRIMVNANRSRFRKRRVTEQLTDRVPDRGTATEAGWHRDRRALIDALQELPAGQRAVVVLRYWMDMTEPEVAATLGCSVGNVKSQASRALVKLRHILLAAAPGTEMTVRTDMARGPQA